MNSFRGETVTIHYNSDLSDDVIFIQHKVGKEVERFFISGQFLFNFFAKFVRDKKIEKIEKMKNSEVLGCA